MYRHNMPAIDAFYKVSICCAVTINNIVALTVNSGSMLCRGADAFSILKVWRRIGVIPAFFRLKPSPSPDFQFRYYGWWRFGVKIYLDSIKLVIDAIPYHCSHRLVLFFFRFHSLHCTWFIISYCKFQNFANSKTIGPFQMFLHQYTLEKARKKIFLGLDKDKYYTRIPPIWQIIRAVLSFELRSVHRS